MKRKFTRQSVALRGLRGRENLSQIELAEKINLSVSTISKMENGKKHISSENAEKFADILNTKSGMFD